PAPRSRRSFISGVGRLVGAAGLSHFFPGAIERAFAQTAGGKERLIVRSVRPEDLETPVALLNSWITPNDWFYVRHHLYKPQVNARGWTRQVEGEVDRPPAPPLDELRRIPRAAATATLECAGNGGAFFAPPVAGIQWEKGAVGTARWTGTHLSDVLKQA